MGVYWLRQKDCVMHLKRQLHSRVEGSETAALGSIHSIPVELNKEFFIPDVVSYRFGHEVFDGVPILNRIADKGGRNINKGSSDVCNVFVGNLKGFLGARIDIQAVVIQDGLTVFP